MSFIDNVKRCDRLIQSMSAGRLTESSAKREIKGLADRIHADAATVRRPELSLKDRVTLVAIKGHISDKLHELVINPGSFRSSFLNPSRTKRAIETIIRDISSFGHVPYSAELELLLKNQRELDNILDLPADTPLTIKIDKQSQMIVALISSMAPADKDRLINAWLQGLKTSLSSYEFTELLLGLKSALPHTHAFLEEIENSFKGIPELNEQQISVLQLISKAKAAESLVSLEPSPLVVFLGNLVNLRDPKRSADRIQAALGAIPFDPALKNAFKTYFEEKTMSEMRLTEASLAYHTEHLGRPEPFLSIDRIIDTVPDFLCSGEVVATNFLKAFLNSKDRDQFFLRLYARTSVGVSSNFKGMLNVMSWGFDLKKYDLYPDANKKIFQKAVLDVARQIVGMRASAMRLSDIERMSGDDFARNVAEILNFAREDFIDSSSYEQVQRYLVYMYNILAKQVEPVAMLESSIPFKITSRPDFIRVLEDTYITNPRSSLLSGVILGIGNVGLRDTECCLAIREVVSKVLPKRLTSTQDLARAQTLLEFSREFYREFNRSERQGATAHHFFMELTYGLLALPISEHTVELLRIISSNFPLCDSHFFSERASLSARVMGDEGKALFNASPFNFLRLCKSLGVSKSEVDRFIRENPFPLSVLLKMPPPPTSADFFGPAMSLLFDTAILTSSPGISDKDMKILRGWYMNVYAFTHSYKNTDGESIDISSLIAITTRQFLDMDDPDLLDSFDLGFEKILSALPEDKIVTLGEIEPLRERLKSVAPFYLLQVDALAELATKRQNFEACTRAFEKPRAFGVDDATLAAVNLDDLVSLFDSITFVDRYTTLSSQRVECPSSLLRDEDQVAQFTPERFKESLRSLISKIRTRDGSVTAVPSEDPGKELYYSILEKTLRAVILQLKERVTTRRDLDEVGTTLLEIAKGSRYCGTRWILAAQTSYSQLTRDTPPPPAFEQMIIHFLFDLRMGIVEKVIPDLHPRNHFLATYHSALGLRESLEGYLATSDVDSLPAFSRAYTPAAMVEHIIGNTESLQQTRETSAEGLQRVFKESRSPEELRSIGCVPFEEIVSDSRFTALVAAVDEIATKPITLETLVTDFGAKTEYEMLLRGLCNLSVLKELKGDFLFGSHFQEAIDHITRLSFTPEELSRINLPETGLESFKALIEQKLKATSLAGADGELSEQGALIAMILQESFESNREGTLRALSTKNVSEITEILKSYVKGNLDAFLMKVIEKSLIKAGKSVDKGALRAFKNFLSEQFKGQLLKLVTKEISLEEFQTEVFETVKLSKATQLAKTALIDLFGSADVIREDAEKLARTMLRGSPKDKEAMLKTIVDERNAAIYPQLLLKPILKMREWYLALEHTRFVRPKEGLTARGSSSVST